jgi:hypothetical protein
MNPLNDLSNVIINALNQMENETDLIMMFITSQFHSSIQEEGENYHYEFTIQNRQFIFNIESFPTLDFV